MHNRYRSGSEKKTGELLDSLRVSYSFEPHYINYTWIEYKKYLPDFLLPNGIILEVKGRFKLEDRKKHLFIKEAYPELDIRFVFDNPNNKLNKGGKATYADWCVKNDFMFCKNTDHQVIEEWSNERGSTTRRRDVSSKRRASSRKQTNKPREGSVSKRNSTSSSRRNKARNTK